MRIAVPDLVSNSYFPAVAAVELGYAAAEGIALELELMFPVTRAMAALRAGELDFVAGSAHSTLTAFTQWRGAKLLVALAQYMYWCLVLRADLGVARGDVTAVKGLRIGAAPGVDLGLHALLRAAGIDPRRDNVQIAPVPGATAAGMSFGVTAAKALEERRIDGFWANAMGTEVALRRGIGTLVLDVRRGDGPPAARHFTFPALIATEATIEQRPEAVAAAIRAVVRAQTALRTDPGCARAIGARLFPALEAEIIADLIERDAPYYDPHITDAAVTHMNAFAHDVGLLAAPVGYEQVVAAQFRPLWTPATGRPA